MNLFPLNSTCDLLRNQLGAAFWAGAYWADRNIWLQKAREAGISQDQRRLRVAFARASHRIYLLQRRCLKVSI